MKNNSATVYIPGLWALLQHSGNSVIDNMPSLRQLLKRHDSYTVSSAETEALLLGQLGWQVDGNADVPVAALELKRQHALTEKANNRYYLCADPIHLQEDHRCLIMSYPSVLDITLAESTELANSINQHFADDGWHLEVTAKNRWYLALDHNPHIQTTPAWRVAGRDVFKRMPVGENRSQWHSWLMELQMLLFSHPVNEKRTKKGLATISSLWLWGGGYLPELTNSLQYRPYGDSLFMQGVVKQCGGELDYNATGLEFANIESVKSPLILLEHARDALQTGRLDQGVEALIKLEKDVFTVLHVLLKSKKLHHVSLVDSPGKIIEFSSSGANKWWRRRNVDVTLVNT